jgi:alkanesulfonate monooxygenase SsuD/methylene tetrahydromethanopterin reductase-like flavin-dependent oxidoreductase (luciferase family)
MEFILFLPQMRLSMAVLEERARTAEAAGFHGIALMDHLAPPLADDKPMFEAMTTAAWLAARTTTLTITHLVLCDAFRSPAVLARQAVTIDHASDGRFELGIGAGSVPAEFATFGIENSGLGARVRRLLETLDVLALLWSGEPVDYDGEFHRLTAAQQLPTPLRKIPIVIGGTSAAILDAASEHADWWNVPLISSDRIAELHPQALPARASVQQMVAFVADEQSRQETSQLAERRFGHMGGRGAVIGDSAELCEHFGAWTEKGVERAYVWFSDFAEVGTLEQFGAEVISRC